MQRFKKDNKEEKTNFNFNMKRKLLIAALGLTVLASCTRTTDLYDPTYGENNTPKAESNSFDFSTSQSVNLTVDYSACGAGAVFFSIYAEYPLSDDEDPVLKEDLQPVFESYTHSSGIFTNSKKAVPKNTRRRYSTILQWSITSITGSLISRSLREIMP